MRGENGEERELKQRETVGGERIRQRIYSERERERGRERERKRER